MTFVIFGVTSWPLMLVLALCFHVESSCLQVIGIGEGMETARLAPAHTQVLHIIRDYFSGRSFFLKIFDVKAARFIRNYPYQRAYELEIL